MWLHHFFTVEKYTLDGIFYHFSGKSIYLFECVIDICQTFSWIDIIRNTAQMWADRHDDMNVTLGVIRLVLLLKTKPLHWLNHLRINSSNNWRKVKRKSEHGQNNLNVFGSFLNQKRLFQISGNFFETDKIYCWYFASSIFQVNVFWVALF